MESGDPRVTRVQAAARDPRVLKVPWVHRAQEVQMERKEHKEDRVREELREERGNLDRMGKRAPQATREGAAEMVKTDPED